MQEEQLISKKDVLDQMGISYGQLYRWKRKGLIPEAWFIRRSTFTGQETFFPTEKIVERIRQIKDMKGDHALDDLAEVISETVHAKVSVALDSLRRLEWFDEDLARVSGLRDDGRVSLPDALRLAVLRRLRRSAREEEVDLASRTLSRELAAGDPSSLEGKTLHLLRKKLSSPGISAEISVILIAQEQVILDPEMRAVDAVDLSATFQQVKLDLAGSYGPEKQEMSTDLHEQRRQEHE